LQGRAIKVRIALLTISVGLEVGSIVGEPVKTRPLALVKDGSWEGDEDGILDGASVINEGDSEGWSVGQAVGVSVCAVVAVRVGGTEGGELDFTDGSPLGYCDGDSDGS
jgi:hypothetical protein